MQSNEEGELESVFTLYPFVQLNPRMGNVAEPYTKHYLDRDIYTHITYAELEEREKSEDISEHNINLGDTIFGKNTFLVLDSLNRNPNKENRGLTEKDLALGANFTLYDVQTNAHAIQPLFVIRDRQYSFSIPDSVPNAGISISFEGIDPETESFAFKLKESDPKYREFIVMKAIIFPWINVLWVGCIIMALGTFLAVYHRFKKQ